MSSLNSGRSHGSHSHSTEEYLIGGFSNYFKGWGLEDSYFGSKMIAEGNYVIPVLSCGVYHIDHPPRSGSEKKKLQELEGNLARYKELLDKSY